MARYSGSPLLLKDALYTRCSASFIRNARSCKTSLTIPGSWYPSPLATGGILGTAGAQALRDVIDRRLLCATDGDSLLTMRVSNLLRQRGNESPVVLDFL
jgi:hypothetical protein